MSQNKYYNTIKDMQNKINEYVKIIFKVYGNELLLMLEDYNLLSNKNNCIESSTAIGFLMEEFIISKLEIFTNEHIGKDIKVYRINRNDASTPNCSYDCYSNYKGILNMINVKVQKKGSNNDALAAINILYNDYLREPEQLKSYLVFKVKYDFGESHKVDNRGSSQRVIKIEDILSFFLEEIDFSNEHQQDHRNWSKKFNANSGRLIMSNKFRETNRIALEHISYENTKKMLENLYIVNNRRI